MTCHWFRHHAGVNCIPLLTCHLHRMLPGCRGLVSGLQVLPLHSFGSEHVALVRWAPGTVFQPYGHPGGEEIVVLEGVFQDEHGSYPTGTWLRHPPGSVNRPWSETGCTILV
jgi:anti-sigma factor ChrR (cupin superfamily)